MAEQAVPLDQPRQQQQAEILWPESVAGLAAGPSQPLGHLCRRLMVGIGGFPTGSSPQHRAAPAAKAVLNAQSVDQVIGDLPGVDGL